MSPRVTRRLWNAAPVRPVRPLSGAAVDAGIVVGDPTLCTPSVVRHDESPLLALAALHWGFPEVIGGLRWVPLGSSDT